MSKKDQCLSELIFSALLEAVTSVPIFTGDASHLESFLRRMESVNDARLRYDPGNPTLRRRITCAILSRLSPAVIARLHLPEEASWPSLRMKLREAFGGNRSSSLDDKATSLIRMRRRPNETMSDFTRRFHNSQSALERRVNNNAHTQEPREARLRLKIYRAMAGSVMQYETQYMLRNLGRTINQERIQEPQQDQEDDDGWQKVKPARRRRKPKLNIPLEAPLQRRRDCVCQLQDPPLSDTDNETSTPPTPLPAPEVILQEPPPRTNPNSSFPPITIFFVLVYLYTLFCLIFCQSRTCSNDES